MAKEKNSKKSKLQIRRRIRKSLGALCLATAIAVAAIPVAENQATSGDPGTNTKGDPVQSLFDERRAHANGTDSSEAVKDPFIYDVEATYNSEYNKDIEDDPLGVLSALSDVAAKGYVDREDYEKEPELYRGKTVVDKIYYITDAEDESADMDFYDYVYKVYKSPIANGYVITEYNPNYIRNDMVLSSELRMDYEYITSGERAQIEQLSGGEVFAIRNNNGTVEDISLKYVSDDTLWSSYHKTLDESKGGGYIKVPKIKIWNSGSGYKRDTTSPNTGMSSIKFMEEFYTGEKSVNDLVPNDGDIYAMTYDEIDPNDRTRYLCMMTAPKFQIDDSALTGFKLAEVINIAGRDLDGDGKADGSFFVPQLEDERQASEYFVSNVDKNTGYLAGKVSTEFVTAIADNAFKQQGSVNFVTLPVSLKYIGNNAFEDNTEIHEITCPSILAIGNQAFKGSGITADIQLSNGISTVGAEAFAKCKSLTGVYFPSSIRTIGAGAFANCEKLSSITFGKDTSDCVIKKYAFFNNMSLENIDWGNATSVVRIDKGAFSANGSPGFAESKEFSFPAGYADKNILNGDYILAGQTNLEKVNMPGNNWGSYDYTSVDPSIYRFIPAYTFYNCTSLEEMNLTVNNQNASIKADFDRGLFAESQNPNMHVRGPKLNGTNPAEPRKCTWEEQTFVSNYVPYVFEEDGKEYWEYNDVDSGYLLCIRREGNDGYVESVIVSPQAASRPSVAVDVVIPATMEDITLRGIDEGAFDKDGGLENENSIRNRIESLTIVSDGENGVKELGANLFAGSPKLSKVDLGDSVVKVGDGAFQNCQNLMEIRLGEGCTDIGNNAFAGLGNNQNYNTNVKVIFESEDDVTFGDNAFSTNGNGMIFSGRDTDLGSFTPFNYAMNNPINSNGLYICYKTNAPSNLTIINDKTTGESVPTLMDYPHFEELDAYSEDFIEGWQNDWYGRYQNEAGLNALKAYYNKYNELVNTQHKPDREAQEILYESGEDGPWRNEFNISQISVDDRHGGPNTDYFDDYPFSIQECYTTDKAGSTRPWFSVYDDAQAIVNGALNIVIPDGVKSIDVKKYYDNAAANRANIDKYFTGTRLKYMNQGTDVDTIPGLFSAYLIEDKAEWLTDDNGGYILDDQGNKIPAVKLIRGNDYIQSIDLGSVEYLPDYCFDSCEKLNSVKIGPELESVGKLPFRGCSEMTLLDADENDKIIYEGGIIYTKNEDDAYYTVEEALQGWDFANLDAGSAENPTLALASRMQDNAFEDCDELISLNLLNNHVLTTIPTNAFHDCDKLRNVSLPTNVREILADAFTDCDSLNNSGEVTIRGKEVYIVFDAFDHPSGTAPDSPCINTYADSAALTYAQYYNHLYEIIGDNQYEVFFVDYDGSYVEVNGAESQWVEAGELAIEPDTSILLYSRLDEGYIFSGWNPAVNTPITAETRFYAQYEQYEPPVGVYYSVTFVNYDGTIIPVNGMNVQKVHAGDPAEKPETNPTREGYYFTGWKPNNFDRILADTTFVAQFESNSSGKGDGDDKDKDDDKEDTYLVTVINGLGSGRYKKGKTVTITANPAPEGQKFYIWTTDSEGVEIQSVTSTTTTFKMPDKKVTVTANFRQDDGSSLGMSYSTNTPGNTTLGTPGGGNGNGGGGSSSVKTPSRTTPETKTNARVEITKGGIPSTEKAVARVNGSNDNFVVKISEDPNADVFAQAALESTYGAPLDGRIMYTAMDISLYDETGQVKITDTTGLTVDITMPLPSKTQQYGGNNKIASVENAQVEALGATYRDMSGTPMISFTATHFSPYAIYVDLEHLNHDLDVIGAYKTGDPIHPKWFLSIGLACLSGVLFLKKDKKSKIA